MNPYLELQTFLIAKSVKGHIKKGYLLVDLPPIKTFQCTKHGEKVNSDFHIAKNFHIGRFIVESRH